MKKKLIYDVGMHIGTDTNIYLKKDFDVIGIEADPYFCERNYKKFEWYIKNKRLTILEIGIDRKKGIKKFYMNQKFPSLSSFSFHYATKRLREYKEFRYQPHDVIFIQTVPISDIIKKYGMPYYMKIDIEGYEIHCLNKLRKDFKPKYISAEVGNNIKVAVKLRKIGYNKFKLIDQQRNQPHGSSGEFGNNAIDFETNKNWKTYPEILNSLKKLAFPNPAWFDIHATYENTKEKYSKIRLSLLEFETRHKKIIGKIGIILKRYFPKVYFQLKRELPIR